MGLAVAVVHGRDSSCHGGSGNQKIEFAPEVERPVFACKGCGKNPSTHCEDVMLSLLIKSQLANNSQARRE